MKYLFTLLCLWMTPNLRAQHLDEWLHQKKSRTLYLARQLAVWKSYGQILRQGYATGAEALAILGQLSLQDYQQHADHFSSWQRPGSAFSVTGLQDEMDTLTAEVYRIKNQLILLTSDFSQSSETNATRKAVKQLWSQAQQIQAAYQALEAGDLRMRPAERWVQRQGLYSRMRGLRTESLRLLTTLWRLHAATIRYSRDHDFLSTLQTHVR